MVITVADDRPGMSAADLDRVFERFTRLEGALPTPPNDKRHPQRAPLRICDRQSVNL